MRLSNFKLDSIKRDNIGLPYVEFILNGYDENGVLVESKKASIYYIDEKKIDNTGRYEKEGSTHFSSKVLKIVLGECVE